MNKYRSMIPKVIQRIFMILIIVIAISVIPIKMMVAQDLKRISSLTTATQTVDHINQGQAILFL